MTKNPAAIANALAAQSQVNSSVSVPGVSPLAQYNQFMGPMTPGLQQGLPRPLVDFLAGAFGPLSPITPMPVDAPRDGEERALPRRWQYPVGWNLPIGQPGSEGLKLVPFSTMRQLADQYSVVRAMLNIRTQELAGLTWDVGPTPNTQSETKGDKGAGKDQRERSNQIVRWFKRIDSNYYGFQSWFTAALEDMFVIDAMSLHRLPPRVKGKGLFGSNLAEVELLNGETIRPLLDIRGAMPRPPSVAYQQYLWGVPRSDLMAILSDEDLEDLDMGNDEAQSYSADQLLYLPRLKRSWTPYGFSPIEQAILPITLGLQRQGFLLDYFTEGTIPGVYVVAGDQYVTPAQQRQLQDTLNALAGDVAWKHRVIVLPPGSTTDPQKDLTWQKDVDQTIIEQVGMTLHIQPHEVGMVAGGRSSGLGGKGMVEGQQNAVAEQRTEPDRRWLKETFFDPLIQEVFGQEDLEWKWLDFDEEEDEAAQAQAQDVRIKGGQRTIDEERVEAGLDPFNLPLTKTPFLLGGPGGLIPLDPTVPPPTPPPPLPGLGPEIGPDGKPLPPKIGPDGKPLPPAAGGKPPFGGQPAAAPGGKPPFGGAPGAAQPAAGAKPAAPGVPGVPGAKPGAKPKPGEQPAGDADQQAADQASSAHTVASQAHAQASAAHAQAAAAHAQAATGHPDVGDKPGDGMGDSVDSGKSPSDGSGKGPDEPPAKGGSKTPPPKADPKADPAAPPKAGPKAKPGAKPAADPSADPKAKPAADAKSDPVDDAPIDERIASIVGQYIEDQTGRRPTVDEVHAITRLVMRGEAGDLGKDDTKGDSGPNVTLKPRTKKPVPKMVIADLMKKVHYDGNLTKIVYRYLLRSYPKDAVEWVKNTEGGDWTFERHVPLADINMARRPGGRNPDKVESIGKSLDKGASMDPVVLVERTDQSEYKYDIADGWHRCLGAEHAGLDDLPAFIGSGFDDKADWGLEMQDVSDSIKKAARAEASVLRRYLRNGNDLAKFSARSIDRDVMALLREEAPLLGGGRALDEALRRINKGPGNPQALRDWFNAGADGQIDWGDPGDFDACVNVASDHMEAEDARGYCNLRHTDSTGGAPGAETATKDFSLTSPLSTGLVPYDLAGQAPQRPISRCRHCGLALDSDQMCPIHGAALNKFDINETRDDHGRWVEGPGGGSTSTPSTDPSTPGHDGSAAMAADASAAGDARGNATPADDGINHHLTDAQIRHRVDELLNPPKKGKGGKGKGKGGKAKRGRARGTRRKGGKGGRHVLGHTVGTKPGTTGKPGTKPTTGKPGTKPTTKPGTKPSGTKPKAKPSGAKPKAKPINNTIYRGPGWRHRDREEPTPKRRPGAPTATTPSAATPKQRPGGPDGETVRRNPRPAVAANPLAERPRSAAASPLIERERRLPVRAEKMEMLAAIDAELARRGVAVADLPKYSPDQPRDDHGRWGEGDAGPWLPGVPADTRIPGLKMPHEGHDGHHDDHHDGHHHDGHDGHDGHHHGHLSSVKDDAETAALGGLAGLTGMADAAEGLLDVSQKYSEEQPRDDHGRFSDGSGEPATEDVRSAVLEGAARGGFSVQPYRATVPRSGYQVAMTGRTSLLDASVADDHEALTAALHDFVESNKDVLTPGGHTYIGGWVEGGKLYLEPSERVSSRAEAVRLGSERDQIAVWDNRNQREVPTGGTGAVKAAGARRGAQQLGDDDGRGEARGGGADGDGHATGPAQGVAKGVTAPDPGADGSG